MGYLNFRNQEQLRWVDICQESMFYHITLGEVWQPDANPERNWEEFYSLVVLTVPWREHSKCHTEPHGGSTQIHREAEGACGGQAPILWFPWEGKVEAGQAGWGLTNLNKFSSLWSKEAVLGYLAPVPGAVRAGYSGPKCESPITLVVGGVHLAAQEGELTSLQPGQFLQSLVKTESFKTVLETGGYHRGQGDE